MKKKLDVKKLVILSAFVAIMFILGLTPIGLIRLGFCNATTLCIPVVTGAILLGWKEGLILGAVFGGISAFGAFGNAPSGLMAPLVSSVPVLAFLICVIPRLTVPLVSRGVFVLAGRNRVMPYILSAAITLLCIVAAVNSFDTIESKIKDMMVPAPAQAEQAVPENDTDIVDTAEATEGKGIDTARLATAHTIAILIAVGIPLVWVVVFTVILILHKRTKLQSLNTPMAAATGSLTNTVLYLGMIYLAYRFTGLDAASILSLLIGFGMFAGMIEAILAALIAPVVNTAIEKAGYGKAKQV